MKRMMFMLTLLGLGYLVYANYQSAQSCFRILDDIIDGFMVRQEMKRLADAVEQEYLVSETLPVGDFSGFVRNNFKRNVNSDRDPAHDWWGTAYRISRHEKGFGIGCAGPDKRWETRDDVWLHRPLDRLPRTR